MVVFPYIRPPKEIIESVPDTWFLGSSETGWMRSETFYKFIANGFKQWLTDNDIEKPVLLLVDGHKSHLTMELSEFCHDNQIFFYSFLANCTHILQMADVSIFKSLKSDYKQTVLNWLGKSEDSDISLTKTTFCPLLQSVLQEKDLAGSIRNGFRSTDYSKCVQNNIEKLHSQTRFQEPSVDDILTASNVINYMRDSIIGNGINLDVLLKVLRDGINSPARGEIKLDDPLVSTHSIYNEYISIDELQIQCVDEIL